MTTEDKGLIIFTGASSRGWHRLQQAAECLQKYAWHYGTQTMAGVVDREADRKRPALLKGELMHLALAQHYARIYQAQHGDDPDTFLAPKEAIAFMADVRGGREFVALITAVYEAYCERYYRDADELTIEGIERLFEPICDVFQR